MNSTDHKLWPAKCLHLVTSKPCFLFCEKNTQNTWTYIIYISTYTYMPFIFIYLPSEKEKKCCITSSYVFYCFQLWILQILLKEKCQTLWLYLQCPHCRNAPLSWKLNLATPILDQPVRFPPQLCYLFVNSDIYQN